ncbi:MAG: hypothetical protein ACK5KT_06130 [Dysgonomonas sp.]
MDIQKLYSIVEKDINPIISEIEPLRNMVESHPYFQVAIFAYLKAIYLFENGIFEQELARLSISVSDRRALFYYILSEEYDQFFKQTGKKEIQEDRTNILLNAFFESRGENSSDNYLEYSLSHSSLISSDYFSYTEAISEKDKSDSQQEAIPLKHQNIIDTFITKSEIEGGIHLPLVGNEDYDSHQENSEFVSDSDELNEDVFFTETLAKIYIKQKKYEKAYKIIKHLSLNYPKKNIYFADQLNFLEKLIINSKYKDTK